tara:strand:+ start:1118 stop:2128 length:1011 start_codon:yes stop_codon:yes gene_type:complete
MSVKYTYAANFSRNLLILLFLSSCLGLNINKTEKLKYLPKFYISPKQNNQSMLYGVGEGYNLHSATKSALSNASSKLMTNISANSEMLIQSSNDNFTDQYRERINEKLEKITFNNYQISDSANFKDKIYVEIAIDRNSFVKQNAIKLNNLNKRFNNLFNNLEQKNIIDQYRNLNKIQNKLYEAKILNVILDSIKHKTIDYQQNYQNYNNYQNYYDNVLEKMLFKIDPKSDKSIARIIKKGLSDQKIKITNKDSKSNNLILLKIEKEEFSDKIYGSFIVKLRVNFSLVSQNKTLASNFIEASGSSVISTKEAKNSAILAIHQKIADESIEYILGLKI